jgi:hypothetical protein
VRFTLGGLSPVSALLAGKKFVPWPADYRVGGFANRIGLNFANNLHDFNVGVKEWIGLAAYSLTRRTSDEIEIADCLAVQH